MKIIVILKFYSYQIFRGNKGQQHPRRVYMYTVQTVQMLYWSWLKTWCSCCCSHNVWTQCLSEEEVVRADLHHVSTWAGRYRSVLLLLSTYYSASANFGHFFIWPQKSSAFKESLSFLVITKCHEERLQMYLSQFSCCFHFRYNLHLTCLCLWKQKVYIAFNTRRSKERVPVVEM